MKPQAFSEFCEAYGFVLTASQAVLGTVCFDRVNPFELGEAHRRVALELFGDVAEIPKAASAIVVWVKGARIGGSRMAGMRLYQLALTVDLDLAPGESAYGLIVGPDMRLARQAYGYALGAANLDAAAGRIVLVREGKESFTFERHDGHIVTIECLPATSGGSAVRGRTLVGAVMTEAAFFKDENYAINDVEVYRALTARIVLGGQLVIESTPWAESGLLFDLYAANHKHPKTALVAVAPTLLMRDDDHTRSVVAREIENNPDNAEVEFGANFLGTGSGSFLDPVAVDACIDAGLDLPRLPAAGATTSAAGDLAFKRDSSAYVGLERLGDAYAVLDLLELVPKSGAPLKPRATCLDFATRTKAIGAPWLVVDNHYVESVREHLSEAHLGVLEIPGAAKVTSYLQLRKLVNERRIRIPKHVRLLTQLKGLVSKPTSGGGLTISSPRRGNSGGHGDLVSALVAAIWDLEQRPAVSISCPPPTYFAPGGAGFDDLATPTTITGLNGSAFSSPSAQSDAAVNAELRKWAGSDNPTVSGWQVGDGDNGSGMDGF